MRYRKQHSRASRLTELEGVVLGLIGDEGPCTTYHVRRDLLRSPTPGWSASAGSVYPLIERLAAAGMVNRRARNDNRGSQLLAITPKGAAELRRWVLRLDDEIAGLPMDPARTRVRFLRLLSRREQNAFLRRLLARLEQDIKWKKKHAAEEARKGAFDGLNAAGAVLAQQARLEMVRRVLARTKR